MNRDDIIRMAREAGWTNYSLMVSVEVKRLEHFANLVAAAEAAKWANGAKISIPTMAMEQEFSNYHRLGYKAGVAAEREACAKVCEDASKPRDDEMHSGLQWAGLLLAAAIRARGNSESL